MAKDDGPILTLQQLKDYEELGFLHSIPILSLDEVSYYRAQIEKTCEAIGDRVTRLDGLHLFFSWAWELGTHPHLLDVLEQLLGPNIVLKSTRLLYKYGSTSSYVGWHQDGITERLEDDRAPAIWLGLTDATIENGCLRVVPRSHRLGLWQHDSSPALETLPGSKAPVESWFRAHGDELSGRITSVPPDPSSAFDLVMSAGEMSIHHPVILHGSNANLSTGARIGLSASYSTPELYHGRRAVVWARGDGPKDSYGFEVIDQAPASAFAEAVAAYCASGRQILLAVV